MNPNPFLGVLLHWTGGLSAASCYLPFRGIHRWRWEVYWFVQGCFSWIVAPAVFAILLVPGTAHIITSAAHSTLFYAWFWGAMWGIGGLLFGLGVRYLGIALGYTIALGFSTAFGTLGPPLFAHELAGIAHETSGQVTLLGVAICLLAITISGFAGRMKERDLAVTKPSVEQPSTAAVPEGRDEYFFARGAIIAAAAGILSACFAYALAAGKSMDEASLTILQTHHRSGLWQSLPTLIVVLWGGFTTNALWCSGLFLRNRSAGELLQLSLGASRLTRNYLFAASAGLLWYFQFFFYSMGASNMGRYGFSSWSLHMAGTIIFATLWGVALHEWKGTKRRTQFVGIAGFVMLIASTIVIGYGNYLKAH